MKAVIDRDLLIKALKMIGAAVPARSSLPCLMHTHLEFVEPGTVIVGATDLEWYVRVHVGARVEAPGETTLPYRHLSALIPTFPGNELTMVGIDPEKPIPSGIHRESGPIEVEISQGDRAATLKAGDPHEYPVYNPDLGGDASAFDPAFFGPFIESIVYATATDESRPVLTGVFINMQEGVLSMAAADGFRAAMDERRIDGLDLLGKVIIKGHHMAAIAKYLAHEVHPVEVRIDPHAAKVSFSMMGGAGDHAGLSGIDVISQAIEGSFVNVKQIANTGCKTWITLDRAGLLGAVKAAMVIARLEANSIHVRFSGDRAWLTAEALETGDISIPVPCEVQGEVEEPGALALNGVFFQDALTALTCHKVRIGYVSPSRPVLLVPGDGDKQCKYQAVIMPMFVRGG